MERLRPGALVMQGELRTSDGTHSLRTADQAPTIATKLVAPPTPAYLIVRKRLLDRLDAGSRGPLVLLCAPPGAGKTILLASWLQTRRVPGPPAWLSLDEDDNDASRLAADLLSALRTAGVIRRGSVLDRLAPPHGARADVFMAMLVNGLAKLRSPFLIALDDVHELISPQAIGMLDFLVRHAPRQCHLLLSSRADPPIPIERLRVSGALSELRAADLAFDRDEAGELYRQMDLSLCDADVDTLWRRTEGWAAALRLAGLSAQSHREPHRFVAELAGTERAVADYLVAEVLAHAPTERRAFMLRTSLVDSLCPELGDALTCMEGSASTLAALERSGAPVQPTAADGLWYRYHPLFRELLRAHLRHSHSEEVPLLHRRAARWYAEHGHVRSAIRHALAGESWEQAGSLIEEHWLELFISGASLSMRAQISKLPAEVVAANPRLAVAFAGSRLEDGDMQSAERYLSLAQSAASLQADTRLALSFAAVALMRARLQLDGAQARRFADELTTLSGMPEEPGGLRLRSFAQVNLGATLLWSEDFELAEASLRESLGMARQCGCAHLELDCQAQLALAGLLGGHLSQADHMALEALALAERCGLDGSPAAACAYLVAGNVAYWRGEIERAEGLASRAVSAAQAAPASVRLASRVLMAAALAAGGPRSAREAIVTLDALSAALRNQASAPGFLIASLEDTQARALLAAGEIKAARSLLAALRSDPVENAALQVRHAEAALRDGQLDLARCFLADLRDRSPGESPSLQPSVAAQIEARLLLALAAQADSEPEAAAQALEHALELAEEDQVCGPFLMRGGALQGLLERQAQRGTEHPALLEVLLDAMAQRSGAAGEPGILARPLTEREMKILRFLPTMLSNAEIGAETFVSLNTVKTHLRNIYRKLDATNRADAVARARTLGLLPQGIGRRHTARQG
jgi:LuxR family transcriptional regulator, maltose regulon positive regulatory protein